MISNSLVLSVDEKLCISSVFAVFCRILYYHACIMSLLLRLGFIKLNVLVNISAHMTILLCSSKCTSITLEVIVVVALC